MPMPMPMPPKAAPSVSAAAVEARLRAQLQPLGMWVRDDSAAHAGHAPAHPGSHFAVRIVSARFTGLGRVARHRLVYDALADLMRQGIHALSIDALAPEEASE